MAHLRCTVQRQVVQATACALAAASAQFGPAFDRCVAGSPILPCWNGGSNARKQASSAQNKHTSCLSWLHSSRVTAGGPCHDLFCDVKTGVEPMTIHVSKRCSGLHSAALLKGQCGRCKHNCVQHSCNTRAVLPLTRHGGASQPLAHSTSDLFRGRAAFAPTQASGFKACEQACAEGMPSCTGPTHVRSNPSLCTPPFVHACCPH